MNAMRVKYINAGLGRNTGYKPTGRFWENIFLFHTERPCEEADGGKVWRRRLVEDGVRDCCTVNNVHCAANRWGHRTLLKTNALKGFVIFCYSDSCVTLNIPL